QGLCRYLELEAKEVLQANGVVIGFDSRHNSERFAETAAAVFLSQGFKVHLFGACVPTPFVAAGVAEIGAAAGIMVTARACACSWSQQVYWGNGTQITPPHDEGIANAITQNLDLWSLPEDVRNHTLDPTEQITSTYFAKLESLRYRGLEENGKAHPLTYTPLHGLGAAPVQRALSQFGLPAPHVVAVQAQPDPEFPTVAFPNPEEGAGTWRLAFEEGAARGDRLVMANDPDVDRLCVAEADPGTSGGWRAFTGNEMAALIAHWVWANYRRTHPQVPASNCAMLASTVSSKFLAAMSAAEGFRFEETLTGFKWIGNRAIELEQQGVQVLFAFEEAIGFMLGPYKDKDGISAAAVFAEMAADAYAHGTTLKETLAELYDRYGFSAFRSGYFIADRPELNKAVFERLRAGGKYPQTIAGLRVTSVRDLGTGLDTSRPNQRTTMPWRQGDMMITYNMEGGGTLTLRASGTEPKLKYYLEVVSDAGTATQTADRLAEAVDCELVQAQQSGLRRPATCH
ncbi:phosphoglucomutase, partial [Dunaliella salina]